MATISAGKLPSEIFREHSLACYISDPTALKWREDIGIDIIAWECDYPHSDCIWPDAPETLHRDLEAAGAPDEHIDKITWQNTCRWFDYDPFAHIPKEQATVGALRALSPDVDVTVRSKRGMALAVSGLPPAPGADFAVFAAEMSSS